ncbi:MAG TPA: carboxypeptidase regulatory-like domain-containing protein [Vicinamibacterales bacterium]|nr:carboxypeptidase regulatory-like domain-containing protein [Vicinamibacterales bacterium]
MRHGTLGLIAAALVVITAAPSAAQQPRPENARLLVTVVDPSGAVIPGAKVTVTGQEPATLKPEIAPASTTIGGIAAFETLSPGRYAVQAEFAGFETVTVRDVRLRAGDNRRSIALPIKKVAEDLTVGRDGQTSALDPRGNAFSTVLTREQIAALPDDPDEMERMLKAMAPPGATIRVDGFSGGKLPPKSQIRSIRLPRMDMFAAQNHGGLQGMIFIDIMTQPGNGSLRGSADLTYRDDALNARNPFTPLKGDESMKQGGGSLSGTIVPNKSSFFITAQKARLFDSGSLLAALPDSTVAQAIRRPADRMTFNGRFDQALNRDHVLRFSFQRNAMDLGNLGVGSFDLLERAYSTNSSDNIFRMSENGALGRRFFTESRLQVRWTNSESRSAIESPTIRVLDAFTGGGAQQSGGRRVTEFEAATDLDYVRGVHSFRTGILLEGGRYRSDEFSNYLGTFTFASLADYEAGRPTTYTRRLGDPNISYTNLQVGLYVQDDYRMARSLMLSYGLRYEAQTLIADQRNFSPRLSLTYSPLKSGKTTFRGGVGYFSDWLGTSTYEQTLRVDGFRQQEFNVLNPEYPDPGLGGATPPTNRYLLRDGLVLPASLGANIGVDQALTSSLRLNVGYSFRKGSHLLRGRNLNAPESGARPDPRFSNIVEVQSDAGSRTHALNIGASLMMLNWRQTFFHANYTLGSTKTNTTGAFGLPANGDDLAAEWGLAAARHRVGGMISMQPIRNFGVSMNFRAQSGTPYNVTTGADGNGDGLFNDRPAGLSRNSARTDTQWDLGLRLSYAIGFGQRPQTSGPGGGQTVVMIGGAGGGGGMPGAVGGGAVDKRFRVEVYASAQNVTNHKNYIGYSGVLTSPFFGLPTNVLNSRKIEIGTRFGF